MAQLTLFEVSWEVCNKVGGIHTVISTKAKTLVGKHGDAYVAVGPWLLGEAERRPALIEERGYEAFADECRAMGVPVRIGRWQIPGRPLTILVEFSRLFERKDEILGRLWETHRVDSLLGSWDYVEPVLFGYAAGIVIERWFEAFGARGGGRAVAQFHEWMVGSGMLYLGSQVPSIGTVFTTHATILGRSLAGRGQHPEEITSRPEDLAEELGIRAKHSMEAACARSADVFTTVSEVTAREATLFFGRQPEPLLPNGIDLEVLDELAGPTTRATAGAALRSLARRFLGRDLGDAALLSISGRYEFHNKGIDLLLEAMAQLDRQPGRRIVLFVMVPAANSGVRGDLLERLRAEHDGDGRNAAPLGISTHNLFDPERDPVQQACARLGLRNDPGARVSVIQVPIYFSTNDGLLNLPYEAVTRAMDLTAYPSFYEPWGYTPEESLALGVPTVTTDCAGFGVWVQQHDLGPEHGVHVIARRQVGYETSRDELARVLESRIVEPADRLLADACRQTAQMTAWSDLIQHYEDAFQQALVAAGVRDAGRAQRPRYLAMQVTPTTVGQRPQLRRFEVKNSLPATLQPLAELSRNLWWSWHPEAIALWSELSPKWDACGHNPLRLLAQAFAPDLQQKSEDPDYVARLERVRQRFHEYLSSAPRVSGAISARHPVAYFCAEYGIHESLPVYSGGLGILAGDHLKSASDLGLPLVGIGLFYRKGYLRQQLSPQLEQIALELDNDPRQLPMELVLEDDGKPLELTLNLPSSALVLRAWRVHVGRVDLYLLDSDVESNRAEDRGITHQLYGGDQENRLRQEIVLGRGGVRLLHRLGIEPSVFHLNEGHAAFAAIERTGLLLRHEGLTYDEARTLIRATTAFTSHTPIPAGHDRFSEALMRRYFSDVEHWTGLSWDRFFALGATEGDNLFNMTMLASRFASFVNGVSKLHAQTTRDILQPLWPMLLSSEIPVTSITNGVHAATWTHPRIARLLGAEGRRVRGRDFPEQVTKVPLAELWAFRQSSRAALRNVITRRLETAFGQRHDSPTQLARMLAGLDGEALWLGFARRFVPYKRVDLLLRDLKRLERLLGNEARPVRILFAGKAHPHDRAGQELVHRVAELARSEAFLGRVLFLEDHDVELARALVAGVDVWLNTPLRPLEASGTSGMKAALNGVLNLSIADGWWAEAYDGDNGWRIGNGTSQSPSLQDEMDAAHLYRLLEEEVVPLWYEREHGLPRRWLERMQRCLVTIPPVFDSDRMVNEYRERAYEPLAQGFHSLRAEGAAFLRHAVEQHRNVRRGFAQIRVVAAHVTDVRDVEAAETIHAQVELELGPLRPEDVRVELVLGFVRGAHDLQRPNLVELRPDGAPGAGTSTFTGSHVLGRSGSFAYGIRVRAAMREPWDSILIDLVLWAGAEPGTA